MPASAVSHGLILATLHKHTPNMDKNRRDQVRQQWFFAGATCNTTGKALRIALALCIATLSIAAQAQARYRPDNAAVMLTSSVHVQSGKDSALRALDKAWRAQPTNLDASLAYARAVFITGLTEGDLRWFGSAKAAMTPWWLAKELPADAYFLRGLIKQGFHDFRAGLEDINLAIAREPGRPEFWSWRFALHLLLADMAAAQQDAQEMARLFGEQEASVYRAILLYRGGQAKAAITSLEGLRIAPDFQGASSQEWLGFHLGEAYRVAGQAEQAITLWKKQLQTSPRSHLLRLSLADVLNQQGRHREARQIATMSGPSDSTTDALLMQTLLASRGLKDGDEVRLASLFEARMKSQALRQESLIERPKLVYLISYGKDLTAGLALSIENWKLQKEPADAVLFAQAALALQQPRAAEPVVAWANETRYTDPQLSPLLAQLKAHPRWSGGTQ
ncbi:MAG: hypothetical protein RJA34_1638 [Pseudomonadota bacterium]